jgi:hypothetical protein
MTEILEEKIGDCGLCFASIYPDYNYKLLKNGSRVCLTCYAELVADGQLTEADVLEDHCK